MESSSATLGHGLAHARRSPGNRLRVALSSAAAAGLGVLPHVLHHAGPLAGAALFGGATGSVVFGALGLIAAIPFLVRLHRRRGGWRGPLVMLVAMVAAFTLSTLFVGPAIPGDDSETASSAPDALDHDAHH